MVAYFTTLVRALLLALVLVFATQTADARHTTEQTQARTTAGTDARAEHEDPPLEGVLIIAGVVGIVILLAWICSRIGDNRSHVVN